MEEDRQRRLRPRQSLCEAFMLGEKTARSPI